MSDTARHLLRGLATAASKATTPDGYHAIVVAVISCERSLTIAESVDEINDDGFVRRLERPIGHDRVFDADAGNLAS